MYDWPEVAPALDAFWDLIQQELTKVGIDNAPADLTRDIGMMEGWLDPALMIGQSCGWPYANLLRGKVVPFARFDYGLQTCASGHYYSVYIAKSDDDAKYLQSAESLLLAGSIAINREDSQSGFRVWGEILNANPGDMLPGSSLIETGSHRSSVIAVAEGRATIAAIDAVSFELAKRYEPNAAADVCVIGRSNPKPGLPLVTAHSMAFRTSALFQSVKLALQRLDKTQKDTLLIKDVIEAHDHDYDVFFSGNEFV